MAKRTYKSVPMRVLKNETIIRVCAGNDTMPKLNAYNGYTLHTQSGKEFVLWNSMGETCLNEIKEI